MTISQGGQDTELHGTLETGSRHFNVAVGGTFDHLHVGHKLLLTMTAFLLEPSHASNSHQRRLIVGITGDELLKNKKYIEYLGSWNDRQEAAADFISTITDFRYSSQTKPTTESRSVELLPGQRAIQTQVFADLRVEYVELTDPFGPTVTDESISALIISAETRSGGEAVNTKRQEAGWKALEVFEVDVLDAGGASAKDECFQDKISSTEIRRLKAEKANA
ncbi:MAG: hypothetical protein M1837_005996 [Sclerophora amabilis]|nr:MAG: hypothetical protein M1837_005996 [Sclerophora amabilis]